jgi:hypothetical protein
MPFLSVFYLLLGVVLVYPGAGFLLSGAFSCLYGFCQIAAEISSNVRAVSPPVFEMWLYIFGLFVLLRCRGLLRRSAAILLTALVLRWLLFPCVDNFHIIVCSTGRSSPPMIVFADCRENNAVIIDPSKSSLSAYVADHLKRCGIMKAEAVMFSRNSVRNIRGLRTLLRRFPVDRVVVPPQAKYDKISYFRSELAGCGVKKVAEYEKSAEKVKIIRQKSTLFLEYFDRGAKLKIVLVLKKLTSGYRVELKETASAVEAVDLACDGVERIHIYEFRK